MHGPIPHASDKHVQASRIVSLSQPLLYVLRQTAVGLALALTVDGCPAGHETTGATLSRVLPELQKQPQILEQLRAEQASVTSRHGDAITCTVLKPPDDNVTVCVQVFLCTRRTWEVTISCTPLALTHQDIACFFVLSSSMGHSVNCFMVLCR